MVTNQRNETHKKNQKPSVSAKQLKKNLNLDGEPTPALLALAQLPDGPVAAGKQGKSIKVSTTPRDLEAFVKEAIISHSIGDILAKARQENSYSLSQVAKRVKATRGRVAQVEHPSANLEINTLVRYAEALGYRVNITLEPTSKDKSVLKAVL